MWLYKAMLGAEKKHGAVWEKGINGLLGGQNE